MDPFIKSPGMPENGEKINLRGTPKVTMASLPAGNNRVFVSHPSTFSAIWQSANSHLYLNADEAYQQAKATQGSMRRDPVIMEPLRQRMLATALLDFQIVPKEDADPIQKKICDELTDNVKQIKHFVKFKMCLLEAIWFGKYAANVQYQWSKQNPKAMVPHTWLPVHGDKLKFEHDTGNVGIMLGSYARVPSELDYRWDTESRVVMIPDGSWRKSFIIHKHEIEDGDFFEGRSAGSIHGVGLRTRCWWPWWFKQKLIQWLMQFAERNALGITVWYYESGNRDSEEAVRRAAEENNENLNIFYPRSVLDGKQGAGIERLEVGTGGAEMFKAVADEYWGDQIKRMIVGQTLTSQTGATGLGSEVAKQHKDTFENLVKFDSINLSETLTDEMLDVLVEYNFPGCPWRPRLELVIQPVDPKAAMEAAKLFVDMGGEASEDEMRELAGLKKPVKGESVLGGAAAQAAQQPMPGMPQAAQPQLKPQPLNLDALAASKDGEPWRFEGDTGPRHAPKGGVIIHGIEYKGGQWIPSEVIDRMTDQQRAVLDAHSQPPGNAESPVKDMPDGDYELWEASHEGFTPANRTSEGKSKNRVSKFSGIDSELDDQTRKRLDEMKSQIPPSWTGIEISNDPDSDILIYAKDKKGETKYVYHPKYQARQHAAKFERVYQFMNNGLEQFRNRATADMMGPEGPRKEAAMVLYLQDKTGFRIDSGGAAGRVKAYGASSLESRHVEIAGDTVHFDFIGKEGVRNTGSVTDPFLAKEMAARKAQGGKLFKTNYNRITTYFKKSAGERFLVKDLRTIKASETALAEIDRIATPKTVEEFHAARKKVGEAVAEKLNHTIKFVKDKTTGEKTPIIKDGKPYRDPGMALDNYIPPEVFSEWQLNLLRNGISIRLLGDSPKTPATAKKTPPKEKTAPAGGTPKKAKQTPKPKTQAQLFRRMTWAEFCNPLHFAKFNEAEDDAIANLIAAYLASEIDDDELKEAFAAIIEDDMDDAEQNYRAGEPIRFANWAGPTTGPRGGIYYTNSETGRKWYRNTQPGSGRQVWAAARKHLGVRTKQEFELYHNAKRIYDRAIAGKISVAEAAGSFAALTKKSKKKPAEPPKEKTPDKQPDKIYPSIVRHGMKEPEPMEEEYDREQQVRFLWPKDNEVYKNKYQTAKASFIKLPNALKRATREIVITTQKSNEDDFWAREYSMPGFVSGATGGDGTIVFYPGGSAWLDTMAHESGHNLAKQLWGTTSPPAYTRYGDAQKKEPPVTEYGKVRPSEEFADAVKLWVTNPSYLIANFPLKYAAIKELMSA